MSWSYSKSGSKEELKKFLDEEAPKALAHVTGVERTIADQALGLARATVEAISPDTSDKYDIKLSANGSAVFDGDGNQIAQSISVTVSPVWKGN